MIKSWIFSLLLFVSLGNHAKAVQLTNAPSTYFGGENNQAYLDWIASNNIESKYTASMYMVTGADPANGAAIHWKTEGDSLHFAVIAKATGWLGFGIAESGGMLGSDMALFEAAKPQEIVDAYVVDTFGKPNTDDCQQDWELVDSASTDGFLMFEAKRLLDTKDPQDKKIVQDSDPFIPAHRVIAAWGDQAQVDYHGNNVARGAVRFFSSTDDESDFDEKMQAQSEGSFFLRANDYLIPTDETTYEDFCFTRSDLISLGVPDTTDPLNMIGFKPIVEEGNTAHVHHYVLTASMNGTDGACADTDQGFNSMTYVWAPGEGSFALPDFLGSSLFGPSGFQSFVLEIHYDNPENKEGVRDSSGVQVYYTSQPREHEMGVLQLGDPFVSLFDTTIGNDLSSHVFNCPSACSETFLQQPVTVVREYHHMHKEGARFVNEQIRDGSVIRRATVEVWDFDQNGNTAIQQEPYEVKPGDGFRTSCFYKDSRGDTKFGLASNEEMCIAFLYYYPRQIIQADFGEFDWICAHGLEALDNACFESHDTEAVATIDREFGIAMDNCPAPEVPPGTGADADADADEDETPEGGTSGSVMPSKNAVFTMGTVVAGAVAWFM